MANQPNKGNTIDETLLLTTLAAEKSKQSGGQSSNAALDAVLASLARKLQKEQDDEEGRIEELKRQRIASLKNIEQEEAAKKFRQNSCSHLKENGKSRLGGQRMSDGRFFFLCQNCGKEFWSPARSQFGEDPLPPHLMIPGDLVGSAA